MGNALNENIEGRFVLVRKDWFKSDLQDTLGSDVRERVLLAKGGFGCTAALMGNAVFVEFLVDGERTRVEGYELESRFATPEEIESAISERIRRGITVSDAILAALMNEKERA